MFLLIGASGLAQQVSVSQNTNNSEDLAYNLLDNGCIDISNAAMSSGNSVAEFNNNGGAFPIEEGVLIRTGDAAHSGGNYTGNNLSDNLNSNTDQFLETLNTQSGQNTEITDVAFLEFEFLPLSNKLNFDFIFASNEYGEWQCTSSDVFAFLLTNLTTGQTTNLAVIPGTSTPISVKEIKDQLYNATCGSDNPELFDSYQPEATNSVVNMRGFTQLMTASADITPGNPYKIRLVIGDSDDSNYDSAIFLSGGSFETALDLGPDTSICDGESIQLETGLDIETYNHKWFFNGEEINGENNNNLSCNQTGEYTVTITQNTSNCTFSDTIVISNLEIEEAQDLSQCDSGAESYTYDLTQNNAQILGINPSNYNLSYYASMLEVENNNPIPTAQLSSYSSLGNQTIFIEVSNSQNNLACTNITSFELLLNDGLTLNNPEDIYSCTFPETPNLVNLNQVIPSMVNGQNNYNFDFYLSENDAFAQENPIEAPENYSPTSPTETQTIWVRVSSPNNQDCFSIKSFEIHKTPSPLVDTIPEVIECSAYILPEIANGNYYTEENGEGELLNPGEIIDEPGTYYIYNTSEETGCSNQSSFTVILIDQYSIKEDHCGAFNVPSPPAGAFYTAPGGPNGSGQEIFPGTAFHENTVVHYYAEIDGQVCKDEAFPINILPLPAVDEPENVVTCESYTLPALQNGAYFTDFLGSGEALSAGDVITETKFLYVFNDDGTCINEHEFKVTIIPEYADITACGEYSLPALEVGAFYTQANGDGQAFAPQEVLTSSQSVYYHAETTSSPNCTLNKSFEVEITPLPEIDQMEDVLLCEGDSFSLPPLTNGNYFTEENGNGTLMHAGQSISSSQTLYIYNFENSCANQSEFNIEIRPLPAIENFTDMHVCEPYELPELQYGRYFTQPHANGTELFPGDLISSTQTIHIYAQYEDLTSCVKEDAFTVYFDGVILGDFENIEACVEYVLPTLDKGSYFTESGGEGTQLYAGDAITTSQEVFVYSIQGTRFVCENEESFMVNINGLPDLSAFEDIESCGSYTLPTENSQGFSLEYYWDSNQENSLTNLNISQAGSHTIYVVAQDDTETGCSVQKKFNLTITKRPTLNIEDATLCKNVQTGEVISPAVLISGIDTAVFEVQWFYDGELIYTGPEFETEQIGVYTVKTEKLTPEISDDCNYAPVEVEVFESSQARIKTKVSQPFEDIAQITVNITKGYGDYEYQLNGGAFQQSNIFYNVPAGVHRLKVRGIEGYCGITTTQVTVIKHPKYFTPNQDGINDTWNISDLKDYPDAKIYIFDRYGKLITGITPNGKGWNGTLNSKNLPSNDYWFRVEFTYEGNKVTYMSHITLKR